MNKQQYDETIKKVISSPRSDLQKMLALQNAFDLYVKEETGRSMMLGFIKKLKARLEKLRDRYQDKYGFCSDSVDYGKTIGLNDAIKIVDELAEEYKDDWIPCNEQMPKENSYVYASCHSLCDDRPDWVAQTFYRDGWNIPIVDWGGAEVTAWMYREEPKPYQPK